MSEFKYLDCKCDRRHFVSSGFGSGGRHRITVCKDCGKIFVFTDKDGVSSETRFHINSLDTLEAIGKWTRYVNEVDESEATP